MVPDLTKNINILLYKLNTGECSCMATKHYIKIKIFHECITFLEKNKLKK